MKKRDKKESDKNRHFTDNIRESDDRQTVKENEKGAGNIMKN